MDIEDKRDTAPARRRIIQQPLRTEPPVALIANEGKAIEELEARLKRAHPLITFPSISHFLAEPPRAVPWYAIVVARTCAWDPRLEDYVRRSSCIALYGLAEEGYGWPETVVRLRDLTDLDPWFEGLANPVEPEPKKRVKRKPRTTSKPGILSDLADSWRKVREPASTTPATEATEADAQPKQQPLEFAAPPEKPAQPAVQEATPSKRARQLELPIPTPRGRKTKPAPARRRPERAEKRTKLAARPVRKPRAALPDKPARASAPGDAAFIQLAAELGLVRAAALLEQLRDHARGASVSKRRG